MQSGQENAVQWIMAATRGNRRALRHWVRAAALFTAWCSPGLPGSAADVGAYKLAPGDRIMVTVFGESELSGEVHIDGAGNVRLPFIGPIEVQNLTVQEGQKRILDRLADGILKQPSVSVHITELRPLSILGDVRTPGSYPFRYGSTVKNAIALAGGLGIAEHLQRTIASEFLAADERVRQLHAQERASLVRQARLEAQRHGSATFSPPASLGAEADDIADVVASERETLASQAAILKNQLDLLRSQKPRLQDEIAALNEQIGMEKKKLELARQRTADYEHLMNKDLARRSVVIELKIADAQLESNLWKLTGDLSRLQINAGDIDLKIGEFEMQFKKQVTTELQDLRQRLEELKVTLPAARAIREVKLEQAGSLVGAEPIHTITITRGRNGEAVVLQGAEATALQPGDIIDVKRLSAQVSAGSGASAGQPRVAAKRER